MKSTQSVPTVETQTSQSTGDQKMNLSSRHCLTLIFAAFLATVATQAGPIPVSISDSLTSYEANPYSTTGASWYQADQKNAWMQSPVTPANYSTSGNGHLVYLLEWDLVAAGKPAGKNIDTVTSATVKLNHNNQIGRSFTIYRLTGSLAGGNDTWNDKPAIDDSTSVSYTTAHAYGSNGLFDTVDLSALLANNGTMDTFGIALLPNVDMGLSNIFQTKEFTGWPSPAGDGKLSAAFTVPEPASIVLLCLGGVACLCRRRRQA